MYQQYTKSGRIYLLVTYKLINVRTFFNNGIKENNNL